MAHDNDILARAGITGEALAFSLPGALANYDSNGNWKYSAHTKLIEDKLLDVANGKCKRLMINCPPRMGKPVYEEELVLMSDGSYKKLKDVAVGDLVITHEGRPRKVTNVYVQGNLPCKLIETFLGNEVIAAYDHPFLTADGWKEVKDLKVGDTLAVLNQPRLIRNNNPISDIAKFAVAGYLVGDGYTNIRGATFTNEDPLIIEDFVEQVNNLGEGFSVTINEKHENKAKALVMIANCGKGNAKNDPNRNTISSWVKRLQIKGNSYTKTIPNWVFTGTDEQIGAFIGAFFSCDGTISARRSKENNKGVCAELNTVNQELMYQTLILLHRLGVRWKLRRRDGSFKNDLYLSYRLGSTHETSVIDFFEKCRVIGAKQKRFVDWNISRKRFPSKYIEDEIVRIIPFNEWPCRCLTVEGDSTFTVNNIVVHNSMLVSHYFPAWFLGRYPDKRIILTSYESNFAASWGRKARNVLEAHGDKIFGIKIAQDTAAADEWGIQNHTGGMSCAGAGSAVTGKGGSVVIIDDPHKDSSEATSKTIQDKIYDWYKSVAYTRLTPDGAVIIIQTRWNVEDLSGKLLKEMKTGEGEDWDIVSLPALAEENDILGRKLGEGLWPDGGWTTEKFLKIKKMQSTSSWIWSALYQQRPANLEGNMIKMSWFQRYKVPPDVTLRTATYLSLDTATKDKELNDYSVIITACEYQNNLYILDVKRDKYEFPRLLHVTENMILSKKPNAVIIEDKASGSQLVQVLRNGTIAAPVIAVTPSTDKATRMMNESPLIESGRVFLPETADWLLDFEDEIRSFPQSLHRDQVDSLSQLCKVWRERMCNPIDIW